MSDPDGDTRPRISRSELRRLREALASHEAPLNVEIGPAAPAQSAQSPRPAQTASRPATILTVCTGNICRSPMAQVLLQAVLRDLRVHVHSGGTHALVGYEMTPQSVQLALAHGADAADAGAHRARLLDEPTVAGADLILTMAREHRSQTVQLSPATLHRAFTVREFARLSSALSDADIRNGVSSAGSEAGARLRALARLVGAQRGMIAPSAQEDDVVDPYRRSDETYARSASELVPAVSEAARAIRAAIG